MFRNMSMFRCYHMLRRLLGIPSHIVYLCYQHRHMVLHSQKLEHRLL